MEAVAEDISFVALIVFPKKLLGWLDSDGDRLSRIRVFQCLSRIRFLFKFIPLVVRLSIAIYIFRYKYDSRFCTSAQCSCSGFGVIVSIAFYLEVIFSCYIRNGLWES